VTRVLSSNARRQPRMHVRRGRHSELDFLFNYHNDYICQVYMLDSRIKNCTVVSGREERNKYIQTQMPVVNTTDSDRSNRYYSYVYMKQIIFERCQQKIVEQTKGTNRYIFTDLLISLTPQPSLLWALHEVSSTWSF